MGSGRSIGVREPEPDGADAPSPGASPSVPPVLRLQRSIGNQAVQRALDPRAAAPPRLSPFDAARTGALEREANDAATEALGARRRSADVAHAAGCSCGGTCPACRRARGIQKLSIGDALGAVGTLAATALASAGLTSAVIVEDGADLQPDQVHRSDFVARARATICAAADDELRAVGADSQGCPYIQHWFGRFASRPAREMERMVALYAMPGQRTPGGFLAALDRRVREGVRTWRSSGRVEGVSERDVMATPGGAIQRQADGADPPSPRSDSPEAVRGRLGAGRALPSRVRRPMEHGFGVSFAGVRVHTDAAAATVAAEQRALALTVGQDVVMGSGTWRPGTPAGDVLIAHELAHTIQQRGGSGAAHGPAHERDADQAALGALTGAGGRPKRRSGLAVQGCSPTEKRCPPGMRWGTVADPQAMGAGSFGCTCVYRCVSDPVFRPAGPSICPSTGCSRVEVVGEEYHFTRSGEMEVLTAPVSERSGMDERSVGWGASATPLGGPATCLCPGVDIQGEDRTEGSHMESIAVDLTDFDVGANPRTGVRDLPSNRVRPGGSSRGKPSRGRAHPESPHPQVTQRGDDWCGAACGEMAARRLGVEISQDQLAAHPSFEPKARVGHTEFPGGFQTEGLRDALREVAPVPGRDWIGGAIRQDISTPAALETHLSGYLGSTGGSVILRVEGGAHWIIVDGILPDGSISIRNPRDQVQSVVTPQELSDMAPTGDIVASFRTSPTGD